MRRVKMASSRKCSREQPARGLRGAENLIHASVRGSDDAGSELDWDGASITVPRLDAAPGTSITLLILPEALEARPAPASVPAGALVGTITRVRRRREAREVSVRLRNGHLVHAMAIGPEPAQDGDTAVLVPERDGFWIVEPTEVRFTDRRSAAVNASPRS